MKSAALSGIITSFRFMAFTDHLSFRNISQLLKEHPIFKKISPAIRRLYADKEARSVLDGAFNGAESIVGQLHQRGIATYYISSVKTLYLLKNPANIVSARKNPRLMPPQN